LTGYLEADLHPQDAPGLNDDEEEAEDDDEDDEDYEGEAPQQPPPVQPHWEPPEGYFNSYFASMQQSMTTHLSRYRPGLLAILRPMDSMSTTIFRPCSKVFKLNLTHTSPTLEMPCTTTCINP
jgi:ABC-type cobalt transport system substrate-binding protein